MALGPGSTVQHADQAAAAFKQLAATARQRSGANGSATAGTPGSNGVSRATPPVSGNGASSAARSLPQLPEMRLSPRDAYFSPSVRIPLSEAPGRASAELLCPYPPGVPVLFPGEVVTDAAMQLLRRTLAQGGCVTGASDATLDTLLVLADD